MIRSLNKFTIDSSSIRPATKKITKEEYLEATIAYIELIQNYKLKIGDLLNAFRDEYPEDIQDYLIFHVKNKTSYAQATLDIIMSLAKHVPVLERSDFLTPTHYHLLQSLKSGLERKKIIELVAERFNAGSPVSAQELSTIVRDAKIRSGQGVGKQGNATKRKSTE